MARNTPKVPPASSEGVHKSMVSNKSCGTKLEEKVRAALAGRGIRGYRLNWNGVPGKPDIAFPHWKLAVFLNGCFWHHCPQCGISIPKTHRNYWRRKLEGNVERDALKRKRLESMGWKVLVIWEHEVSKNPESIARRIVDTLNRLKEESVHNH